MQEDIQITNTDNGEAFTETIEASNEEAPKTDLSEEHEETLTDKSEASPEGEKAPSNDTVDTDTKKPMPPQNEGAGFDGDKKSSSSKSSKQLKITIYPDDEAQKKDIEDLAGIDGMPVSKFILKLIMQELNNRRDDLDVIRRIRAKRA